MNKEAAERRQHIIEKLKEPDKENVTEKEAGRCMESTLGE